MVDVCTDTVAAGKHNTDIKVLTAANILTLLFIQDRENHFSGLVRSGNVIEYHKSTEPSDSKVSTYGDMNV